MSAVMPSASSAGQDAAHRDVPVPAQEAAGHELNKAGKQLSAGDRLALSRTQLRGAMMTIAHPPASAPLFGKGINGVAEQLKTKALELPGAQIVLDTIGSWWRDHPLHTAGIMAGEASKVLVRPLAQRNPQYLILGSLAFGALLMLSRPWRWLLRPALFVGLVPQLASHFFRRMPLESLMRMAASGLRKKSPRVSTVRARAKAPPVYTHSVH